MFIFRKICFTIGIPIIMASSGYGQDQSLVTLDLKKSLTMACDNHLKIKMAALDKEKSASQLNQVEAGFYPQISASASYQDYIKLPTQLIPGEFFGMPGELIPIQFGTQHNLGASLDASMVLFNQPLLVSYKMARKAIELSKLALEKSKEEVIYETAQVYYAAQAFKQQSQTLEKNLESLQRLITLMQEQYDNGFVRKVDLDRVKVNISNLYTQQQNFNEAYTQQLAILKFITGIPQNNDIQLIAQIESSLYDKEFSLIPEEYTDYQQLTTLEELADLKIKESRASYLPSLAAYGQYNFQSQQNNFSSLYEKPDWLKMSFVGISLNIPLFSGFGTYYKVSQARIEKTQAVLQKENLSKYLETQYITSKNKLSVNRQAYDNQLKNVSLAEEVYRVTREQYQKGISPLTEVLDSETALSTSQSALLQALIQVRLTELELLKSTGKLNTLM